MRKLIVTNIVSVDGAFEGPGGNVLALPMDVLNRVTAYEVAGSVAGVAVGQALVGPVSEIVSPRDLLLTPAIRRLRRA